MANEEDPKHPGVELSEGQLTDLYSILFGMQKGGNTPIPLFSDDGTPLYVNIRRVMGDPAFAEWRENHNIKSIYHQFMVGSLGQLAKMGSDMAKFGFSLKQISDAKKIDDTPPDFPKAIARNENLQGALSQAWISANEGLSSAERSLMNEQIDRDFGTDIGNIIRTGGGQAGATQAAAAVAGRRRNLQRIRATAQNQQVRRQNRERLDRLINMQLREDERLNRHRVQKFNYRDMPIWRQRVAAKEALRKAGIENAFGSIDSLIGKAIPFAEDFFQKSPVTAFPGEGDQTATPDTMTPEVEAGTVTTPPGVGGPVTPDTYRDQYMDRTFGLGRDREGNLMYGLDDLPIGYVNDPTKTPVPAMDPTILTGGLDDVYNINAHLKENLPQQFSELSPEELMSYPLRDRYGHGEPFYNYFDRLIQP